MPRIDPSDLEMTSPAAAGGDPIWKRGAVDRRKLRARVRPDASWYKITNLAGEDGPADVVIYDEIGYWGVTAADFMAELKAITANQISLRINSPGGEIFDGIAIYNTLRAHAAHVTAYVDSLAASIASVIAMAGDRIVMQPHSQLMIHDGSGLCIGNAADMRAMADLLDRQSDNIAAIYAERAGGTARQWRERMRAETWYSDREAVDAGLADEVAKMERQEAEPPMAASWDLTIFNYAGRAKAPAPDTSRLVGERDGSVSESSPPPTTPAAPVAAAAAPELFAFDPDVLRAALHAAAEKPFAFDADGFRESLTAITSEAAAVAPQVELDDEPDVDDDEPDDEPEEQTAGDVLAEALQALTQDAPAETAPELEPLPEPPPPPPPLPPDDPPTVEAIWREHFAPVMAAGIALAAGNAPAPPEPEPDPEPGPAAFDAITFTNALKAATRP